MAAIYDNVTYSPHPAEISSYVDIAEALRRRYQIICKNVTYKVHSDRINSYNPYNMSSEKVIITTLSMELSRPESGLQKVKSLLLEDISLSTEMRQIIQASNENEDIKELLDILISTCVLKGYNINI